MLLCGGTHLPDITLVAPVYVQTRGRVARGHTNPDFYVASRAHHADVGGAQAVCVESCARLRRDISNDVQA